MKKLFLSSIILLLFSFSIIIFEMSCKKSASAQTGGTNIITPHYTLITRTVNATGAFEIDLVDSIGNITPIPFPSNLASSMSSSVGYVHFTGDKSGVIYTAGSNQGILYTYHLATGVTTTLDLSSTSSSILVDDAK